MRTTSGSCRHITVLERRCLTGARLFAAGDCTNAEIARRRGVSRQVVLRWHLEWTRAGPKVLQAAGQAGREPKLAPAWLQAVEAALRRAPLVFGLPSNRCTLPRLAAVIVRKTGVRYHPGDVWENATPPEVLKRVCLQAKGSRIQWTGTYWLEKSKQCSA